MIKINKIKEFDLKIKSPPSKAHTLRALIIGSLAEGKTIITNPLLAQDQLNVIACLKDLGIKIEYTPDKIEIEGNGGKYNPIKETLNVGESGVGMNFLTSATCYATKDVTIGGTDRLNERPIQEVVRGLEQLGCKIEYLNYEGFPPIKVKSRKIKGGIAKINGKKTSQYFSSLTISAPYAENKTTLICLDEMTEKPYLDITIEMMEQFGVKVENKNYKEIIIPKGKYIGKTINIEGDYSSASFFFLIAAICKSKIIMTGLNPNTKQGDKKFLDILERMGCKVQIKNDEIKVEGTILKAIDEDMGNVPDIVPPIAVAAAFAEGKSIIRNIAHLRHKESDRIGAVINELTKMGAKATYENESLIIEGSKNLHGAEINTYNDHRIAMSFAVAGMKVGNQTILDEKCVAKSFPDFFERIKIFRE